MHRGNCCSSTSSSSSGSDGEGGFRCVDFRLHLSTPQSWDPTMIRWRAAQELLESLSVADLKVSKQKKNTKIEGWFMYCCIITCSRRNHNDNLHANQSARAKCSLEVNPLAHPCVYVRRSSGSCPFLDWHHVEDGSSHQSSKMILEGESSFTRQTRSPLKIWHDIIVPQRLRTSQ